MEWWSRELTNLEEHRSLPYPVELYFISLVIRSWYAC